MSARPHGIIKQSPDDFIVEELPAYAPSGEGDHVFIRITKTDRTTIDAVQAVARALGCDPRAAGFAGMKDKRAVCTQTISLQPPRGLAPVDLAHRASSLRLDGIVVHEAKLHPNKIKPGHLTGNRFAIAVRGLPPERLPEVTGVLDRIAAEGIPNGFGPQRYGRAGDNAERALAWLRGEERGPRDPRMQRLLWSALQSKVFDAVLDARVRDGTWAAAREGDLLKLRASGGLFLCADVQTDGERAARGELSPTGPIIGARMRWPEGSVADQERQIAFEILGTEFDLSRTRRLGEGSRRALRLWVEDLRYDGGNTRADGHGVPCVWVYFVLPKGAYATTVLAAAIEIEEARDRNDAGEVAESRQTDPNEEPEDPE